MNLERILCVSDLIMGLVSVIAGVVLLITSNSESGVTLEGRNEVVISLFGVQAIVAKALPFSLVITGLCFLTKRVGECVAVLRSLLVRGPSEAPAVSFREPHARRKNLSTKCPRPTLPTGPIHVLPMIEETPESPMTTPKPVKSRSLKKPLQRSRSSRSASDRDVSFTTTVCGSDLTPVAPSCEGLSPISHHALDPSHVPDAIAAIWNTVPSRHENIW